MHPIPADISSARRENTNKNEEKCLTIFCLRNTDEQKGWVFSRESYSCWAQTAYITELHGLQSIDQGMFISGLHAGQVLSLFLSQRPLLSILLRNSIWDKQGKASGRDISPLSLLFIEVFGWFGGERGTHIPITRGTGFICKWNIIYDNEKTERDLEQYLILKDVKLINSVQ